MKKTLIKRTISFKSLFILLFFIAVLKDHPLPAIIHNVSNTAQLQAAINAANIAGPADSIFFTGPITLTAPLPAVTNTYVIDGNSQILDGGSAYRGFLVLGASPTIQDLGIQNVVAVGGAGGGAPNQTCGSGGGGLGAGAGVYAGNGAMPILSNVTVTNPLATGGAAPLVPGGGGQGGGGAGGGLGGDGGAGLTGGTGGGGGGGGYLQGDNGAIGGAGVGGAGGVTNGGMGASTGVAAIAGGYGGGGGGGSEANSAGGVSAGGGFGAGGGAGSSRPNNNPGSPAGFGAGGGGAGRNGTGGAIVYGGGVGGNGGGGNGARGGGGAALGGAIFTDTTSTVTMMTAVNPFFGSALFPGAGANPGITSGLDLFLASGGNFRFDITAGTVALSNPIEADTINSTGGVEKLGPGRLNFSGLANTYQGSTTITAGTLQFDGDGNLGAATTNVVLNGGIWEPTITPLVSNKAVSITAPSFINTPAGFNFTYSGLMTGGSGYTKTGIGTFIPTGANVGYSGTTTLSAGTIQVSADNSLGTGTLDLNGGVFEATASFSSARLVSITGPATIQTTGAGTTLTFNGSIGGGALSLDKTGAGTLELGGVNTFTVPTTVTTGLLRLIGVGTLGNAGDLNLVGGGFEIATGAGTKTIGALTGAGTGVNLNNNILQIASGNYTGVITGTGGITKYGIGTLDLFGVNNYTGQSTITGGVLRLSGAGTLGNNSPLNIVAPGTFEIAAGAGPRTIGTLTGSGGINLNNNNLSIPDGNFSGSISGTGGIEKITAGTLILSGPSIYSGGTTLTDGTLSISADNNLGTGNLVLNGGVFEATASFSSSRLVSITGPATIQTTGGGIILTLNGVISGGAVSLNKTGLGTLELGGANTYTVPTTVTAGLLRLVGAGTLGNMGDLNLVGGGFEIAAGAGTKTIGALTGAGTGINLNNNILEIASGSYSGVISGTGGITKYGAGTLDLFGMNTYTGQSTINGGILRLSGAGTLGSNSPLNITAAGTFEIAAGAGSKTIGTLTGSGGIDLNDNNLSIPDGNFSGGISGTGGIQKITPGTLTLSGASTYSGGTTITDGVLSVSNDNNFGTGDVTMQGGEFQPTVSFSTSKNFAIVGPNPAIINTPAGVTFTLAGTLSGAFPLTKTGSGTFVPTNANVGYSGTTTLNAGTLRVSADNNLGTGPLVLNGGVFEATASFSSSRLVSITGPATIQTTGVGTTLTLNGSMSGGAVSLDKTGLGMLELGGANTFTVPTTVTNGLLRLIGVGTLGNAADLNLVGGGFEIAAGAGTKTIGTLSGSGTGVNLNNNILEIASGSYSGVISGFGGITKYGIGTLDLFGVNTYTGQSTITGGVLSLSAGGTLGASSPLNIGAAGGFEITAGAGPKIIGTLTGSGGIDLNNNNLSIPDGNFSGGIIGTGSIQKITPGTLTLSGANTYSGGTIITDGILSVSSDNNLGTGIVTMQGGEFQPTASFSTSKNFAINGPNPATINTSGGVDLTISGVLSGAFPLTKSGAGTLSLSGANTIIGLTSLTGGTIVLNSSALGGVTMSPGTFLEGVGTINGDFFNAGTISPGFSIGTKTVTGNYTQTAGGTYIVEIEPGGTSDLLNIGGTATLDGTVDLQPLPGVYLEGSTFLVVDAAGGLGGTQFSNLIESHPLTFGVNYTPTQAFVYIVSSQTIIPESPLVQVGGNAQAFLNYLFCDDGSYTPVEPDIVYVLQNLTSLSPEDFVQEIELLTPGQFRGLPLTGLQNSMRAGQTILSRLNSHDFRFQERCHDEKQSHAPVHDVWFQPLGYYYQQDKRENGTGFDVRSYGFSSGTTLVFGDHLTLGIGTSYLYSNLHWKENAGIAKMHTISLGPTIGWIEKNWFVNFLALGGRTFYDVDRMIRFAKIQRVAHNDHKSWDLQGTLSGGYRYRVPNSFMRNFYLQPEVNLSVVAIIESGYQERGSQSLDLDVKSKHSSFFRSQIDLRMIKDFHINNTCVSPSLRVGWLKDTSLQNGKYQSSLYGIDSCKSYFVTKTVSKTVDQLVLGAETIISPHDHFSFELKYEANIGSRSVIQEGTARLLWDF